MWCFGATAGMLLMFASPPATAQRTSATVTPTVFIEGFRSLDSLTRHAAVALRTALARRVTTRHLRVMTTREIEAARSSGSPDDFGAVWSWTDVREAGWAYRTTAIVDVMASRGSGHIELRASMVRPPKSGAITPLPVVRASSLDDAVEILSRRLAADSRLMRDAASTPSGQPPDER